MGLFSELRRRNVFRVGIAYIVAAWLILQVTDVVSPLLGLPEWAPKLVLVLLAAGLVPALIFAWAFELTPEGLKKEKEVDRSESITHLTGRKLDFIIIGILCVGIAFLLIERTWMRESAIATESTDKSIAVLPFVNMSSDPEQEFFSDGITEEILNALASVKELKVAGRTSSFAFKGRNDDLREIGETLGVRHILEGSVRKAGSRIRITAQLIRTDNGFHLWSESYERKLDDVFAIQDEISARILDALKAELVDTQPDAIEAERTDPAVYERYLMAKQRLYTRNRPAIESALDLLDEALAIDPGYAAAQAQRAIATLLLSENNYGTMPREDAHRTALRYIERALELDDGHAEAWASLGLYYTDRPGDTQKAIEALEKALAINPNLLDARNWLQINLGEAGDVRGSLEVLADLAERDPLYKPALSNAVGALAAFGRLADARTLLERYRRFDPNDSVLLQADAIYHLSQGRSAEGHRLAARAMELAPSDFTVNFAYSISLMSTQMVEKLAEEGRFGMQVDALDWLGRRDEAFAAANDSAQAGAPLGLFRLLNRTGRHQELIDYVEERWPNLEAFIEDVPQGNLGHPELEELALAYRRAGDEERLNDALTHLERVMTNLEHAGIDHFVFDLSVASYLALRGEYDAALARARTAVERGKGGWPDLAVDVGALYGLRDDPRLLELDGLIVENVNEQRAMLELEPILARNGAWRD